MNRTYCVYILASRSRNLYTGVTEDLERRMVEHRQGLIAGFTTRYRIFRLVHFEFFSDIRAAIAREKEIKGWRREKKIWLIPPNALRIHLGNIMAFGTIFPYPILAVDGKKELFVNRDEKGHVAISLDLKRPDDKIIATIEDGHFTVNPNDSLDMKHPDRSTLIVRDEYKNEVLNLRIKNKTHLELAALLQYPGKTVRIPKDVSPTNCIGDFGGTAINVVTH